MSQQSHYNEGNAGKKGTSGGQQATAEIASYSRSKIKHGM